MRKNIFLFFLFFISTNVIAVNELILDPSPQSTSNTCQSYSIAYSLAHSGLWFEPIETPKKLRELEIIVRSEIDAFVQEQNTSGKKVTSYHHTAWAEGVKRASSNNLKLRFYYPSSRQDYYKKVTDITGISSTNLIATPISAALVKKPIMTSVTKLNDDSYKNGHIVTILGLAEVASKNSSMEKLEKEMIILNSAVKSNMKIFNMCSEEVTSGDKKYSASVNITNNYKLKDWEGKYMLMWIEEN